MPWIQAVASVLLLAGNFFFVAVEFSVTRARPTMVARLEREGARGARALRHAVDNIDTYLSACQVGITVCSIGLGITAEPLVSHAFESVIGVDIGGVEATTIAFVLAYGVVSMAHVVLGELAPKSLAIARTRSTGLLLLPPMRLFYVATKPVTDLFNWLGNQVLRPFGIPPASEAQSEPHSESELESLMEEAEEHGILEPEERVFASGAFRFGDLRVREVMVPRERAVTLTTDLGVREAALRAAESGHRRLPLCEPSGGLDAVAGMVQLGDLTGALARGDDVALPALARPLPETSEATLLDELLDELRSRERQMALVRDEYGTAVGIITLEDVVEQVMGDIRDELDPVTEPPIEEDREGWRVAGEAHVHHVARELGLDVGEHREATIGGWMIERLGRVPRPGEEVALTDGARVGAVAVEGARVRSVMVRRPGEPPDQEGDAPG